MVPRKLVGWRAAKAIILILNILLSWSMEYDILMAVLAVLAVWPHILDHEGDRGDVVWFPENWWVGGPQKQES